MAVKKIDHTLSLDSPLLLAVGTALRMSDITQTCLHYSDFAETRKIFKSLGIPFAETRRWLISRDVGCDCQLYDMLARNGVFNET